MQNDTIQVLVCTYQGEQFIAEQLDSLIAQTYPFIEVTIFDDCSTDNTVNIIKEYCVEHSIFQLHENIKNVGFLKNFENAISNTEGEYIALCDQDDIWHPDKLKLSMQEMKAGEKHHPNTAVLVHTNLSMIDHLGNTRENSFFSKKGINLPAKKSMSAVLGHCGVMGNTILMNRLLIDRALPFPNGLKYHDYWLALVNELFGARVTLSKALVQYRIHSTNTSNNNQPSKGLLSWKKRDYYLPFMEDGRELPIKHLLDTYELESKDRKLLLGFYSYLMFKKGRLFNVIFLLRNKLLKQSFFYRLSVFYRLMLTKRYGKKE